MTYEQKFEEQDIVYFTAEEMMVKGSSNEEGHCKGKNTDIPSDKWDNSFKIAKVIDEIRRRLGHSIYISSHYRSPAYNSCISGAKYSQHLEATATDISSSGASPSTIWRIAKELRDEGFFSGGIGKYNTFVHVDVRGENADWTG